MPFETRTGLAGTSCTASLIAYPSAKLRILDVSSRHIAASSMRVLVRNQLVEFRVPFSID